MTTAGRSTSAVVADALYRWRHWLSALVLGGAVLLAPFANFTAIDNELTAWFADDDPVYRQYERLREDFDGSRTLIVAIEAPTRDRLLSEEGFDYIQEVTAAIERLPVVDRVVSLSTVTVVDVRPGEAPDEPPLLDVRALFADRGSRSPGEIGQRAIDDDLLRGDIISADGAVTAVIVFFDESRIDDVRVQTLGEIRSIVGAGMPDAFRAYYNGALEISDTYERVTRDNQTRLTPPILVLTVLAIYAMFRSWRYTAVTLFAVLVSLVWTLGLYSLAGFSYNVLSSIIVPMTIVLAVADDVHIVQHYLEARRHGTAEQAFKGSVSHLMAPILGATATTALGMASLGTSQVAAVREFGFGAAIGVSMDFVISMTLVPTLLCWLKPHDRAAPQETWFKGPLVAVSKFSVSRAGPVAAVAGLVAVVALAGLFRIRVDTNHINFFAPSHPLSESARVIDNRLAGIYSFQVLLDGPPEVQLEPQILRRMDQFQEQLRNLEHARKVTGLVDYVKRVHREIGDGSGEREIPDDRRLIAQELFVFTLADEGRVELERVATSDFSKSLITVKQAAMSSDLQYEQMQQVQRLASETFAGTPITPTVTGFGHLFATLDAYLVRSQITSFTTAFVTVFSVIFLVFRSWRFGLLAMVPNLFPVLAVFGVMGWFDISLNVATVMLASVALGVVDDDTVHFISRYRRETALGQSAPRAIETATAHEGRAALTAAIINSCAFAMFAMSEYRPSAWFGGLLSLTMIVAFLAEALILPATITLLPRLLRPEPRARPARADSCQREDRRMTAALLLTAALAASVATTAGPSPQGAPRDRFDIGGEVSVLFDLLPKREVFELRPRLVVDLTIEPADWLRFHAEGLAEALAADRDAYGDVEFGSVRLREGYVELLGKRADLRVGMGRISWGRLDEVQPSDVINPLDAARFLLEGRSEARLPVPLVRGRLYPAEGFTIEGVLVPRFERGSYDEMDEPTSPFNLLNDVVVPPGAVVSTSGIDRRAPDVSWSNPLGGVRASVTAGRVDIAGSFYEGADAFGIITFEPGPSGPATATAGQLVETFHRFRMYAADFETVSGDWAIRGEVAAFERQLAGASVPGAVEGRVLDVGVGFDRRAGAFRVYGTGLYHREWSEVDPEVERSDFNVIGSVDRHFARESHLLRAFAVANPVDRSAFLRGLWAWTLTDNFTLEVSGGAFLGTSDDTLGRFTGRDFVFTRLRVWF